VLGLRRQKRNPRAPRLVFERGAQVRLFATPPDKPSSETCPALLQRRTVLRARHRPPLAGSSRIRSVVGHARHRQHFFEEVAQACLQSRERKSNSSRRPMRGKSNASARPLAASFSMSGPPG